MAAASPVDACTTGAEVLAEDFSSGEIPTGWSTPTGSWSVADERLVGTGDRYDAAERIIADLPHLDHFCLEMTMQFDSAVNSGSWAGPILDIAPDAAAGPWQHALVRHGGGTAFGTSGAADSSWEGDIVGPTQSPFPIGEDIRFTIVVDGEYGEMWIGRDGAAPVKIHETDALARTEDGTIGLILDGATVEYDDIVVTDLNPTATACMDDWNAIDLAAEQAAIGGIAFAEDFTEAAAIDCWTDVNDAWKVANDELVGSSASVDETAALTFGPHLANYRYDATLRVDEASDGAWLAFGGDVARDGSGTWSDDRIGVADLGTTPRDVSVDVHARTATISVDGVAVHEQIIDRTSSGIVGLAVGGATVAIDDVAITKLAAPAAVCIDTERPAEPGSTAQIIAHRGNDGDDGIGDNLIPGYDRSVKVGADAWESDIQMTTDGVPVVRHDGFGQMTLAEFRSAFPGLPTLEEVLGFQKDSRDRKSVV